MKLIILGLLVAILASLGSGLFFLTKEKDNPKKLLRSLQIRIALSIALVVVLVVAWFSGVITPPPAS
ncbi:MAG: twin transmembrane helix small protein [Pseudomonadota bacterium]